MCCGSWIPMEDFAPSDRNALEEDALSEQLRSAVVPAPSPTSLDDDMVKLVAYTIVSIKRDAERVMPKSGDTLVITQRMSEQAFVSFVIARYLESDVYKGLPPE